MRWRLGILGVMAVCTLWSASLAFASHGVLVVAFLDIGQGDAIFIESPSGNQVLIDGGPGKAVLTGLADVMPAGDRSIDVVVATHPDADHIGGLPDVFERFVVSALFDPGITSDTALFAAYTEHKEGEEGLVYTVARRGQVVNLGGGAYLRILFPDRDMAGAESNTASIVAQLVYGDTEVLLTGDSPRAIEAYLVGLEGEYLESDILKVGHHGSKTSSLPLFVESVSPTIGIVSAGCDNRYGHPHHEALEVLRATGSEILSTCEEGIIVFQSDGKELTRIK